MNVYTEAELADILKIDDVAKVAEFRRRLHWPHVKIGRFEVRFTEAQVEQILRQQTVQTVTGAKPSGKIPGQTERSAARRSA